MDHLISGGVVKLRTVEESDGDMLRDWRNRPEVYANLFSRAQITPEMQLRWYRNRVESGEINYTFIIQDVQGKPIGLIYAHDADKDNRRSSFGLYIPDERDRRPGVALEAEYLFLDYLISELNLRKVCCEVFEFNEAVVRLHIGYGFQIEGVLKEHVMHDGELKNIVLMGLLKEDFELRRSRITNLISRMSPRADR